MSQDSNPEPMQSAQQIRKMLRELRQQQTPEQLTRASTQLATTINQASWLEAAQHIALYLPLGGEIDPAPLIKQAWAQAKHCYLPVITSYKTPQMHFTAYNPTTVLERNQFGILEPRSAETQSAKEQAGGFAPEQLDLAFVPLVAFDRDGHRLGMGKGFYDRTFAFRQNNTAKPLLVGLAHSFQEVEKLAPNRWDVDLDLIVTEREIIEPKRAPP